MIDISDLAKRSGVPASTLRYYEERGLIQSVGRRGLRRTFDEHVLERLSLIALGRAAGFSLEEIGGMFKQGQGVAVDRDKLTEKAEALDQQIERLTMIRDALRHTAKCPAPSHMECKNFRYIVRAAGLGLLPPLDQPPKRSA
ncbi:MAG: helix-turn-helix domain-containing protein [Pseudomonadota bacterium]